MKKKQIFSLILAAVLVLVMVVGCGSANEGNGDSGTNNSTSSGNNDNGTSAGGSSNESSSEEVITLKFGHVAVKDFPYDLAARGFAEEVEKQSNGRIKVEVYEAGQLGSERDMVEQVQLGTLDIFAGATAPVTNFVPELKVIDMPFLFKDYDHVWAVFDGEVGDQLAEKIEAAGFKFLGFWDQGFKNISNNKREVRTPADLKGVKIRTQENPLLVDIYKALGADATPMPFPEVYTSIQQGVVDGYEGSIVPFSDIKLYEIQDYLTEARINYAAAVHIMNKDKFESLDPELQQIIVDAAQKFEQEERKYNLEKTNELMELTKNEGVQVIGFDEIDLPAFREAVQPIYEQYNEFDDLMQKIKALEK